MKKNILKIVAFSALALSFTGCGANTDNIDILSSTNIPEIGVFTSTGAYNSGTPYTTSNPYWIFNTSSYGNYLAPARAVVGEVGASTLVPGATYVTLLHSGRVATRMHGLTSLSVRPGDTVIAGGLVGMFFNSTSIAFQVFVDGVSVCPLSYVSATLRTGLFNNPCQ